MKSNFLIFLTFLLVFSACEQKKTVVILKSNLGTKLQVNGEDFIVNGMNWDYFPIGTNHTYSLWKQTDSFIKRALNEEMTLLKEMGVNTIRVYTGIQPKWIRYIYENYGIHTMLNHPFGRYGVLVDAKWLEVTDYSSIAVQEVLLAEVTQLAEEYNNTPGLLLYLLGNENNYGLFWAGSATEDFPEGDEAKRKIGERRGRPMYKLMNEAAAIMKRKDKNHPIAICNGDLLFLDIIAEECENVDILGINMYRGKSFGDTFQRVKEELDKPILFTEFGADAFNVITSAEDQKMQAFYLVENWREIYENTVGMGNASNTIGGFTFHFSDGWWKYGQTINLSIHDQNASWLGAGYDLDLQEEQNNMNEEWFGICAKGPLNKEGLCILYPRAAYYALQDVHKLNPYASKIDSNSISKHFNAIQLENYVLKVNKHADIVKR
jgi:hypothetical protein